MAIEYKDDWLTGFSNMLSSAANITATDAQLKTGIQNQQFNQKMQLDTQKQNVAKERLGATLGYTNALQSFDTFNRGAMEDQSALESTQKELEFLDAQRLLPSEKRTKEYGPLKDTDFMYRRNVLGEKLNTLKARTYANKTMLDNQGSLIKDTGIAVNEYVNILRSLIGG